MGAPMARRLMAAGHVLTVWNRTRAKADALESEGARVAATPIEAASGADAVITMLATPDALEDVVFGAGGLAPEIERGVTLIEMSTVGPLAIRDVAGRLPASAQVVDAPVLGSIPQATEGTLQIFVGATTAQFERWRAVLHSMGTPTRVGPFSSGAAMKIVVNSTLGTSLTAFAEALLLAARLGLEREKVFDVLEASPLGAVAKARRERIVAGRYPTRFTLELARKDLRLVLDAATSLGVDLPVIAAAAEWFESAAGAGYGNLDYSTVVAFTIGTPAEPAPPL
jgi:3-hydroxyisobutyrate dehydrogenase-like beta-hydroxyacid dehydrogenase